MTYQLKNIKHIDDIRGVNEVNKNMKKNGVFLFYYSPMCGFCNNMMPEIEKLDKNLSNYKINKPLYKVNASHINDLHTKDVIINGVPLLVIVNKNGYKEQTYNGNRTADDLKKFLLKHKVIETKKGGGNKRKSFRKKRKTLRNRRKSYNKTRRKLH